MLHQSCFLLKVSTTIEGKVIKIAHKEQQSYISPAKIDLDWALIVVVMNLRHPFCTTIFDKGSNSTNLWIVLVRSFGTKNIRFFSHIQEYTVGWHKLLKIDGGRAFQMPCTCPEVKNADGGNGSCGTAVAILGDLPYRWWKKACTIWDV